MRRLFLRSASVTLLLLGAVCAGTSPESGADPVLPVSVIASAIPDLGSLQDPSETAGASGPAPQAYRNAPEAIEAGAMGRNASLAFFSLGSLAVGGVFYGINASLDRPNVSYTAGDRTRISTAVGIAGVTALIAAGSYLFYTESGDEKAKDWDARVGGGVAPGGGMQVTASLSLPLPSLTR